MVVQEGSDRLLWLEFGRVQTFPYDSITARQRQWLEEEDQLMDYLVDALVRINRHVPVSRLTCFDQADYEEGKIHRTWECHYEYGKAFRLTGDSFANLRTVAFTNPRLFFGGNPFGLFY